MAKNLVVASLIVDLYRLDLFKNIISQCRITRAVTWI